MWLPTLNALATTVTIGLSPRPVGMKLELTVVVCHRLEQVCRWIAAKRTNDIIKGILFCAIVQASHDPF